MAARVGLAAFGLFRRNSGPLVGFLPRTTRDVMITVACIAVGLGCLHRVISPPTIYAAGYDEARFNAIRPGMTADQVVAALGEPIHKWRWSDDGLENWAYSEGYTYTSDHERRWILLKDGVVETVVSDYWYD